MSTGNTINVTGPPIANNTISDFDPIERLKNSSSKEWNDWLSEQRSKSDSQFEPNLKSVNLSGRDLNGFDFSYCDLLWSNFDNCKLENTNFYNAKLDYASFVDADLSFANLQHTTTVGANFSGAIIEAVKADPILQSEPGQLTAKIVRESAPDRIPLTTRIIEVIQERRESSDPQTNAEHTHRLTTVSADWNEWYAENQKKDAFFYARLADFQARDQHMYSCNLDLADLRYANFSEVNLSGSSMAFANLAGADLRDSDLREVDLTGTILRNANLTNCLLPTTPLDEKFIQGARFDDPDNKHVAAPDVKDLSELAQLDTTDLEPQSINHQINENTVAFYNTLEEKLNQSEVMAETLVTQIIKADDRINAIAEAANKLKNIRADQKEIQEQINISSQASAAAAADKAIAGVDDKIKAAVTAVQDNFVFKDAKADWANKSRNHWILFWVTIFLFIAAVMSLVWGSYVFHDEIMKLIPKNQDGSFGFGAIAIITIPIAAIAWVLRIFTRFALQNLTLAQDASQRRIIFDTYIKLVQETAPQMSENDRALMLAAIFRPLPGAHQADVAPPNLLDLIGKKGD